MTKPTSFTGSPIEVIVRSCHYLIPGIERCDGIYFNAARQQLKLITTRKAEDDIFLQDTDLETSEHITLLRNSRSGTEWLPKEKVPHLPFYQKMETNSEIGSEFDKVVLLIKIQNEHDLLMDLVFIYDLSNLRLFGLSTNENLSASHKDIIAKLIFNSIKMLNINYKMVNSSRAIIAATLNENNRKLAELRQSNLDIQLAAQERTIEYCKFRLEKISTHYNRRFYFADCALAQIRQFTGNLQLLDEVLKNAAALAYQIENSEKDVKIIESYLDFSLILIDNEDVNEISGEEFAKEIDYLDYLELIAIKTLQLGEKATGQNIAKNFGKDMTFAAISGFIGKHSSNIRILLKKYPDKWTTLRVEFSSIKKFIEPIKPSEPRSSGDENLLNKTG